MVGRSLESSNYKAMVNVELEKLFVCPACKGELVVAEQSYHCSSCKTTYPILHGIPDFRLRSDRYLTLEQERDKAKRLFKFGQTASFEELLAHYYTITDDVPPELAVRYQAYVLNAPKQALGTLNALSPDSSKDILLDLGCGAGGTLVAATNKYKQVVGADIALRWLVICQKRLEELNIPVNLVCADAEHLPFKDAAFTHVIAADVIEHVYDEKLTIKQCSKQLQIDGLLWLSATNRFCLGPHPLTRIWGIGYLPRAARTAILLKLRGVDSLRFTNLVSPNSIKKACKNVGFDLVSAEPRQLNIEDVSGYPLQDRILIRCYQYILKVKLLKQFLLYVGPAFELIARKND